MAPTAIKEGEMTKEEEAKAAKVEKRKKAEASKKEDKDKEPSAKMAKKEEKPEPVSIYQTILAMERKESEVGLLSTRLISVTGILPGIWILNIFHLSTSVCRCVVLKKIMPCGARLAPS